MSTTEIALHTADREQHGTLFAPESVAVNLAAVLFLHGYESGRTGYAEYAQRLTQESGIVCLTMNLGGHGDSVGDLHSLTPRNHCKEVVGDFDFLAAQHNVDPSRIGVVGASYSGYLTALLTEGRNPKQILLRAPAIYDNPGLDISKKKMDPIAMQQFRLNLTAATPNRALDALREYSGAVLVVESGQDELILPTVPRAYAGAAQGGVLKNMPAATHSLTGPARKIFSDMLVAWASVL
jgi:dienelactone hydrolase